MKNYGKGDKMEYENILRYTLRVDRNLFKKFRYICKYYDRSANGQIVNFIKNSIAKFENAHGIIDVPVDDNSTRNSSEKHIVQKKIG